jgi:hypothetical protein
VSLACGGAGLSVLHSGTPEPGGPVMDGDRAEI